jgi:AcrR family transcriptional regulator
MSISSLSGVVVRRKSNDKRNSILAAATQVFAERGLGAATSAISAAAGIAEGTLFIYFKTKDEMVNALHGAILQDLADAMMVGYPRRKSARLRVEHVWQKYLDWGLANVSEHSILRQVEMWPGLTEETKNAGRATFLEIEQLITEAVETRVFRDLPRQTFEAAMNALADMALKLIRGDGKNEAVYREIGFAMLWGGLAKK